MGVPNVPLRIVNHSKKVCNLYKRAYRCLESHITKRYEAAVLRNRFDVNKDLKDNVKAVELLAAGERELFDKEHCQPLKFANTYGGLTTNRDSVIPDFVLDYWHPLEKAQYPEYFARREQRKKEFSKWWDRTYRKPGTEPEH